jgi:diacylglycerol kinase (ATP)
VTVKTSIDKSGSGMDKQAQPPQAGLAFDATNQIVGDSHALKGGTEHELAGVQDENAVFGHFDFFGQKPHVLLEVDDPGRMVAKDAKESVELHINGRRLNARLIERIEHDAPGRQLFTKGPIRQDHEPDVSYVWRTECNALGWVAQIGQDDDSRLFGVGSQRGKNVSSVCVIGNPAAGDGSAASVANAVVAAAVSAGHDVTLSLPESEAGTNAALRHALQTEVDRVIVVGGDGIVHLAVNALATTPVVLGIVPIGTGNDGARALGLPSAPAAAIEAALQPAVDVDAIRTEHGWALTVATVGFGVGVNKRANRLRWPRGAAVYKRATLEELPGLRPLPLTLIVDGVSHEVSVTLIAVGNGAYFGGDMQICPAADPFDGLLDVTVVGKLGRVELLRFFPTVFTGTHLAHPQVSTYRGRVIELRGPAELWADGEPMGLLPVTLEAIPRALRIAGVPR